MLHQIENGLVVDELPLATGLMPHLLSRTELYVAMLFHDLGKGRSGDHSEIGARMVERTGPRLGLSAEQVETVAWLVRHHLLLSRTAFKRDADDPKTVSDVAEVIQSPERLRLLLIMTAADIRAVGPSVWNGWKGQLLRTLYHETDAALAGTDAGRRRERIAAAQEALAEALTRLAGRGGARLRRAAGSALLAELRDRRASASCRAGARRGGRAARS